MRGAGEHTIICSSRVCLQVGGKGGMHVPGQVDTDVRYLQNGPVHMHQLMEQTFIRLEGGGAWSRDEVWIVSSPDPHTAAVG